MTTTTRTIPRAFAEADAAAERGDDAEYTRLALEELIDRERIKDVLARYARGIDRLDRALVETAFWPEATDHHAIFTGTSEEFLDWAIPNMRAAVDTQQHRIGPPLIRITGDGAAVESYFTCPQFIREPGAAGEARLEMTVGGRFVDRMVKRGREWRILARTVVLDWQRVAPDHRHRWEDGPLAPIPVGHRGHLDRPDASERLFPRTGAGGQ